MKSKKLNSEKYETAFDWSGTFYLLDSPHQANIKEVKKTIKAIESLKIMLKFIKFGFQISTSKEIARRDIVDLFPDFDFEGFDCKKFEDLDFYDFQEIEYSDITLVSLVKEISILKNRLIYSIHNLKNEIIPKYLKIAHKKSFFIIQNLCNAYVTGDEDEIVLSRIQAQSFLSVQGLNIFIYEKTYKRKNYRRIARLIA